jgi:hypothetical protein
MEEIMYTKGPWKSDGHSIHETGEKTGCHRKIATVFSVQSHAAYDAIETEANARLIAASPEMLEALKTALSVLDCCNCQRGHEGLAASRVREVIHKATGK